MWTVLTRDIARVCHVENRSFGLVFANCQSGNVRYSDMSLIYMLSNGVFSLESDWSRTTIISLPSVYFTSQVGTEISHTPSADPTT